MLWPLPMLYVPLKSRHSPPPNENVPISTSPTTTPNGTTTSPHTHIPPPTPPPPPPPRTIPQPMPWTDRNRRCVTTKRTLSRADDCSPSKSDVSESSTLTQTTPRNLTSPQTRPASASNPRNVITKNKERVTHVPLTRGTSTLVGGE